MSSSNLHISMFSYKRNSQHRTIVYHAEGFVCEARSVGGRETEISTGHRRDRHVVRYGIAVDFVTGWNSHHEGDKKPWLLEQGAVAAKKGSESKERCLSRCETLDRSRRKPFT
jgi:hypothetical protein